MLRVHRQSGIAFLPGSSGRRRHQGRTAFTLVELLVVIGILSVLTALTVSSLRVDNSDRVLNATAVLKNALEGARSRALRSGEVRGLRLVVDESDPRIATSLQYVGAPEVGEGSLVITTVEQQQFTVVDASGAFGPMQGRGLLPANGTVPIGTRIRVEIPAQSGKWYNVIGVAVGTNSLVVSGHYRPSIWNSTTSQWLPVPNNGTSSYAIPYRIELIPIALPNEDPIPLPAGTCIDLDGSLLPTTWRVMEGNAAGDFVADVNGNSFFDFSASYVPAMDLLFTPQGTLTGAATTRGILAFHLTQISEPALAYGNLRSIDTSASFSSYAGYPEYLTMADPQNPTRALGIFTNTGAIITADVDTTTVTSNTGFNDDLATQPFMNVIRGRESQ